jgi:dolichol-phosphate mannosyltransferase
MAVRSLAALPVFNERNHVAAVLGEVRRYSNDVLVVDDGSRDGTAEILDQIRGIVVLRHARNLGYGAALKSAFDYAVQHGYDVLVTLDCDGQHEPQRIPEFVAACEGWDLVSGSRYLGDPDNASAAPPERRRINQEITQWLNERLGLKLTDAFCGFKAYRVPSLRRLRLTEPGYGMPLELWVQAARLGWRIRELAVPLIYLEEERSFGGALDNAEVRRRYYYEVLQRSLAAEWESAPVPPVPCGKGQACAGAPQGERP